MVFFWMLSYFPTLDIHSRAFWYAEVLAVESFKGSPILYRYVGTVVRFQDDTFCQRLVGKCKCSSIPHRDAGSVMESCICPNRPSCVVLNHDVAVEMRWRDYRLVRGDEDGVPILRRQTFEVSIFIHRPPQGIGVVPILDVGSIGRGGGGLGTHPPRVISIPIFVLTDDVFFRIVQGGNGRQ